MKRAKRSQKTNFWADHIKRWEVSGTGRMEYCREAGISYWTFREWQKRFQEANESGKTLVQVPLKISSRPQDERNTIDILVNESIRIRIKPGFDGKFLRAVIQELGSDQ